VSADDVTRANESFVLCKWSFCEYQYYGLHISNMCSMTCSRSKARSSESTTHFILRVRLAVLSA